MRRRRWSGAAADAAQGLLRQLPVRLVDERRDLDCAWERGATTIARSATWFYVALAERCRTQLVTADAALRRTVRIDLVVGP